MSTYTDNSSLWDATFKRLLHTQSQYDEMTSKSNPAWSMAQFEAHFMALAPIEARMEQYLAELAAINTELEASITT